MTRAATGKVPRLRLAGPDTCGCERGLAGRSSGHVRAEGSFPRRRGRTAQRNLGHAVASPIAAPFSNLLALRPGGGCRFSRGADSNVPIHRGPARRNGCRSALARPAHSPDRVARSALPATPAGGGGGRRRPFPLAGASPGLTACGETHAAQFSRWGLERRCIPAEPRRFASLIVALRSKYTRYASLARLVSRAPRPHRENWPLSALTRVPPQAVKRGDAGVPERGRNRGRRTGCARHPAGPSRRHAGHRGKTTPERRTGLPGLAVCRPR